jgi:hypothetical protein
VRVALPRGRWRVVLDTGGTAAVSDEDCELGPDSTVWLQSS